jgi:hypothetical protein
VTRATAIFALLLVAGCRTAPRVQRVDAVCEAESLHRHHSAVRAGPRVTFTNGVQAQVLAGHQQPLWAPGEPHVSSRAPTDEFQISAELVVPLWGRP